MAGLLDYISPADLQALTQQFGPSAEDKAAARRQALMALGLGLMGAKKGNEWATVGNAGLNALQQYQNDLRAQSLLRGQAITQGMGALKTGKELQFTDAGLKMLTGGSPGPANPTPVGAPQVGDAGGMSVAPPPGAAPAAPQQQMGSVPSWANPQAELAMGMLGKKDLADIIHRQYQVTQGPSGTLIRNGQIVGQVLPNAGLIVDGKFQPLPKEATDALVGFNTAQKRGEAQVASEYAVENVPTSTGQSVQMTRAQQLQMLNGRQQPQAQLSPQQDAAMRADMQRNGWQNATVNGQPFSLPQTGGGVGQLGVTPNPLAMKAAEAAIQTGAASRQDVNKGAIGQVDKSYEPASNSATVSIPLLHEARKMLDSGKVITGFGANVALNFGRALSQAGYGDAKDPVATTQTFMATQARQVLTIIKSLGSGSGISDADREYAAKIVGGDIKVDEGALRRLIDISEKAQRAAIIAHNKRTEQAARVMQNPDIRDLYYVAPPAEYGGGGQSGWKYLGPR